MNDDKYADDLAEIEALQAEINNATEEQAAQTDEVDASLAPKKPVQDIFEQAEKNEQPADPVVEPETPVEPPAEQEAAAAPEEEPKKQAFVPQQALHAMREKKKEADAEVAELRKQLEELKAAQQQPASNNEALVEALKGIAPQSKPASDEPKRLTAKELAKLKEDDVVSYIETVQQYDREDYEKQLKEQLGAQAEQLEKLSETVTSTVSEYEKQQQQEQEFQQQQAQYQQFETAVKENVQHYASQTPGYAEAYQRLYESRVRAEMTATGSTPQQAVQRVQQLEMQEAHHALTVLGQSPASYWHGVSIAMFGQPAQQEAAAAPAPTQQRPAPAGKPSLDTVAAGQAASSGLANVAQAGNGTSAGLSLEALADMPEDQIAKHMESGTLQRILADLDAQTAPQ